MAKDSATLSSEISSYAHAGCSRFIADFVVESGAHPVSTGLDRAFELSGAPATLGSNENDCEATKLVVKVYRKAAGATSFAAWTTATYTGEWTWVPPNQFGDRCKLVRRGTEPGVLKPNKNGQET